MVETRINLSMNIQDAVIALSEGNPGALTTCMELLKRTSEIDPDAAMGGLGSLLTLDTEGIYGSRIYMLWNDVCNRDISSVLAVLRANQLGQLEGVTSAKINHAIDNRGEGLDLEAIMKAVQKELPTFNVTH
jgi:hypothetical protein